MTQSTLLLGKAGILLFTLGLLAGFVLAKIRNPRLGLSAHLTAVQTGAMLVALALFWQHLALPEGASLYLIYAIIGSSYLLTAGIMLSGIFGASKALPIAGVGHTATKSREALVSVLVYGSSLVMAASYIAICWFAFF
jgi:hydroxylaminobenzene mutase